MIGKRIQLLRKGKNLSQEELAESLNISRQSISKWESGNTLPDIDKLIQLSEYFNVSLDYLVKGEENRVTNNFKDIFYSISIFFLVLANIITIFLFNQNQTNTDIIIGLVLLTLGIFIYISTKVYYTDKTENKYIKFVIPLTTFIPLNLVISILTPGFFTPYPFSIAGFILFFILYLLLNIYFYKKITKNSN